MYRAVPQIDVQGHSPIDIANRRVFLALLRIFRTVPVDVDSDQHEAVAREFWPLIHIAPLKFKSALRASMDRLVAMSRQRIGRRNLEPFTEADQPDWLTDLLRPKRQLPIDPPEPEALTALGQGLVCDTPAFRGLFDEIERRLETQVATETLPTDQNIDWLSSLLSLDIAEQRLLSLCAAMEIGTVDRNMFSRVARPARRVRALQIALQLDAKQVPADSLTETSRLGRSGLLPTGKSVGDLEDLLKLSRLGSNLVTGTFESVEDMAACVLKPLQASGSDVKLVWPQLQVSTDLLTDLLTNALRENARGVNLLFYGAPGTGKTQYAHQLVERAGAAGFRIEDTDDKQRPAGRHERLGNLRLSEIFAPRGRCILLLDEAEDVFQSDYHNPFRDPFGEVDSKSWMNQLLENNRVPVIWISNKISHMDPAYLRRFSYCLEFAVMPRAMRREIASTHLAQVGCSEELMDVVASHARLAPALLASAARFVALSAPPADALQPNGRADMGGHADSAARVMLSGHLKAMGDPFAVCVPPSTTRFTMRYLNVEGRVRPEEVLMSLTRLGRGTVLLGGPAGTGKTQLAAEIARRLGRELVYRTASDINSKWYGESEGNVARLFGECDPTGEVLFLDEAETLLGERSTTSHRADRAVTAEFLRRVEAFEGVFVCATNHAGDFDQALMRRFVFRLRFLPLDAGQRELMLGECLSGWRSDEGTADLSVPPLEAGQRARLQRLDLLTPGDFSNVVKRVRALKLELNASAWIDELEAEHRTKSRGASGSIGFL